MNYRKEPQKLGHCTLRPVMRQGMDAPDMHGSLVESATDDVHSMLYIGDTICICSYKRGVVIECWSLGYHTCKELPQVSGTYKIIC